MTKNLKQLLSIFLTLTIIFAFSAPCFANSTSATDNTNYDVSETEEIIFSDPTNDADISVTDTPNDNPTETPQAEPSSTFDTELDMDYVKSILIDNISANYADTTDLWAVLDMAALGMADKLNKTDEIESLINEIAIKEDATAAELAKGIIAANAIGLNAEEIKTDGDNTVNLIEKLSALDISTLGYVTSGITVMYAYDSKPYKVSGTLDQSAVLQSILDSRAANGLYGYSWDGVDYNDIDSSAMALTALSKYYLAESAEKAEISEELYNSICECVDEMLVKLAELQGENGSYGSSNTDAVMLIALYSLGIDPCTDTRFIKNEINLEDALFAYATEDLSGFKFTSTDESANEMATEQAFRALVTEKNFRANNNKAYNIYTTVAEISDSDNNNNDDKNNGGSSGSSGGASTAPNNKTISVYLAVTGDDIHGENSHTGKYPTWMKKTKFNITKGSTVQDLFREILVDKNGYILDGLENAYIKSVTNPDGDTVSEFDNGSRSGWLYAINNAKPDVGISNYVLEDADYIQLYYTDDYTSDKLPTVSKGSSGGSSGGSGTTSSSSLATPAPTEITPETTASETPIPQNSENEIVFIDITPEFWASAYITKLAGLEILNGYEDNSFKPENSITRAEFVTLLARISGDEISDGELSFIDTKDGEWYNKYIVWAVNNKITNGTDDVHFSPDEFITREDLCVMLARYINLKGIKLERAETNMEFNDNSEISEYAINAVEMLKSASVINGNEDNSFAPKNNATRAEVAKIIALTFFE